MPRSNSQVLPLNMESNAVKIKFCHLTLKDLLTILIGTAIPVAIAIYTAITNEQMQKSAKLAAEEQQRAAKQQRVFDLEQSIELYQQTLYKTFIDDIYILYKDGELNDTANPWVFANARFRATHRQWDTFRKQLILQFLKEQRLIGRQKCTNTYERKHLEDIIRLNGLNFDHIQINSQIGNLKKLDFTCISFDEISMINVTISNTNLNGVTFINSSLNHVEFENVSLQYSTFYNTELNQTDFGNADLEGTRFIDVNLSTVKLTTNQKQQAVFADHWKQDGTIVAGGHGPGSDDDQLNNPHGLYVDENETILIADYLNHRIMEWKLGNTMGRVVAGGNQQGHQLHQLNLPTHVIIDKRTNHLIICDRWNQRVMKWSRKEGTKLGEVLISYIPCYGLFLNDQNYFLYVTDTDRQGIRRFDMNNIMNEVLVAGGNGLGDGLNQFNEPRYMFVDDKYSIYVTDWENHRVMKWLKDAREGIVVAGGQGEGYDATQLSFPNGIFVDEKETIFITEDRNNRVRRWFKDMKQGSVVLEGNQLDVPIGLSFDKYGNMYIAEFNNHRVQRFIIENN